MKTLINLSTIIIAILLCLSKNSYSQLTVKSDGRVDVEAHCPAWGQAIRSYVYDPDACAYALNYQGKDVFFVHASGYLWTKRGGYFGSDLKLKQNVSKINSPLSTLLNLNGIQFKYIDENNSKKSTSSYNTGFRLGLIAQEVEKVLPGIVITLPDSTKAIAYTDLIALLIESVKEQQLVIDNLKCQIKELNEKIALNNLQSANIHNNLEQISKSPSLSQNKPNPFDQKTEISYYLPDYAQSANIYIYDLSGSQLKNIPLQDKGEGTIIINGSELKAGMYHYVLIVNGQEVDSKKMILTN